MLREIRSEEHLPQTDEVALESKEPLFSLVWFRDVAGPSVRILVRPHLPETTAVCLHAKSLQLCPTLCNLMDCM